MESSPLCRAFFSSAARRPAIAKLPGASFYIHLGHVHVHQDHDALPDAIITGSGLKITLTNSVPEAAEALMQKAYALLPHL
jgi:hypothetical protein